MPSPLESLYCPQCGYDLRGIGDTRRCPECGLVIDWDELADSRIPWVHRRHIGRVRAYWRTLWLATVHTKSLSRETFRPVSYADAQRFRFVTSVIAAIKAQIENGTYDDDKKLDVAVDRLLDDLLK